MNESQWVGGPWQSFFLFFFFSLSLSFSLSFPFWPFADLESSTGNSVVASRPCREREREGGGEFRRGFFHFLPERFLARKVELKNRLKMPNVGFQTQWRPLRKLNTSKSHYPSNFLNYHPTYTLTGFDLTTHCSNFLGGRWRNYHYVHMYICRQGIQIQCHQNP
jgi:hypothetical protein